ncbi:30S ribosomal protein S4 [Patescibacteria group bacterium]|nr:30S ribosomal protein S4 [Patescibacteria group bacterium]
MARYTGPVCKLCRREGEKLFLKGKRCETPKCAMLKKNYPPGAHGNKRSFGQKSEYSKQLREKQKAKRIFAIAEKQFRKYYEMADKKSGVTGDLLLQILESRLDNTIYRAGFSDSRSQARQAISHGLIKVNGRKVKTPSILVKEGSKIEIVERAKTSKLFENLAKKKDTSPKWLKVDLKKPIAEVLSLPTKEDTQQGIESQLIVELYSK